MSPLETRVGVYGICIKKNRVLMVNTVCGARSIYNFPGGGAEAGERCVDTLKRECLEEIGCDVRVGFLVCISDKIYYSVDFNNNIFSIYYTIALGGAIDYALQGARWFNLNALPLDMMLQCDKDIMPYIS